MTNYLLFLLYGPLVSWGDIAVDERRPTADHPTKSAILGMIAAALGLHRDEDETQRQLAESYGFAVRLDDPGIFLHDYHTSQRPPGKSMRGLPIRRDELAREKLVTKLSYREHRCDVLATICLWRRTEAMSPYTLDDIASALQEPHFTLYLGRKACPLGLPLLPVQVQKETLADAYASSECRSLLDHAGYIAPSLLERMYSERQSRVFWEGVANVGFDHTQSVERRDQIDHRASWQFRTRLEHEGLCVANMPGT